MDYRDKFKKFCKTKLVINRRYSRSELIQMYEEMYPRTIQNSELIPSDHAYNRFQKISKDDNSYLSKDKCFLRERYGIYTYIGFDNNSHIVAKNADEVICGEWHQGSFTFVEDLDKSPETKNYVEAEIARENINTRVRNSKFMKDAKEHFRKNHDDHLYCEICGKDFLKSYGNYSESIIEGHHLIPLSTYEHSVESKFEDIMMVCPNCHRVIHLHNPLITDKDELKELFNLIRKRNYSNGKKSEKLVRDKIPEIIVADGKRPIVRKLSNSEFANELKVKLLEEVKEVQGASSKEELIEELADVFEVIDALKRVSGLEQFEIDNKRYQKAKKNGAFENQLFLEYVEEDKQ